MRRVMGVLMALGMAATAWANDDETAGPRRQLSPDEIEALLGLAERLEKLEAAAQDGELDKLKKAAEKEKQEELQGLPARLSKLEKQVEAGKATWDASKMLSFASPDGNFTAKIGGRVYVIYRHIFDRKDGLLPAADTIGIDTARLMVDGTFFKQFYYRVEGEAQTTSTAGSFRMKDVWLGWTAIPDYLQIQAGQMKTPWSQEETTSSRFIDFGERSLLNRIAPGHDVGVLLKSTLADKIVEVNLGLFNGNLTRDGFRNAVDSNDEKDLVGRLFVTPFRTLGVRVLQDLRLGFDVTVGERENQLNGIGITTGDLGGTIVNPFIVAGSPNADGKQTRLLYNLSYLFGPAQIRAEYATVKTGLVDTAAESSFLIKSWLVQASYILTGEAKPLENRIKPAANLDLTAGTFGAFEVAARYCVLDTSDGEDAGLVSASANQKTREFAVGLNWWWTSNVVLRLNWERFMFEEDLAIGGSGDGLTDKQDVFYLRWQIDF